MAKIKKILIFAGIAVAIILVYVFFLRPDATPKPALQSTSSQPSPSAPSAGGTASTKVDKTARGDFLTLLLSVKSIKLESAIFENTAFDALKDSSIELVHEGNEGRINPFAKIGFDEPVSPPAPAPETEPQATPPTGSDATSAEPETPATPVSPSPPPAGNTSPTP